MSPARDRPLGVVVVGLALLSDAFRLLGTLVFDQAWLAPQVVRMVDETPWLRWALITLALLGVVAAVGLWFLRRRAWVVAMLLVGISLTFSLLAYAGGRFDPPRLVAFTIIAFYLNQGATRAAFATPGRRRGSAEAAPVPPPTAAPPPGSPAAPRSAP